MDRSHHKSTSIGNPHGQRRHPANQGSSRLLDLLRVFTGKLRQKRAMVGCTHNLTGLHPGQPRKHRPSHPTGCVTRTSRAHRSCRLCATSQDAINHTPKNLEFQTSDGRLNHLSIQPLLSTLFSSYSPISTTISSIPMPLATGKSYLKR